MTTSNQNVRKKRNEAKTPQKAIDPQKALLHAIDQIPVDGARQKLLVFVEVALGHVYDVAWSMGTKRAVQMELASTGERFLVANDAGAQAWVCPAVVKRGALGFKSTDGLKIPPTGWSRRVVHAYMNAVVAKGPFGDVMGEIHQWMVGSGSKRDAQHFTPERLTDATVAFQETPDPQPEGIKIADPTCGSGGMLLALFRKWHKEGRHDSIRNAVVYLNDIDPLCCAMSALQFLTSQIVFNAPLTFVQVSRGDIIAEYFSLELAFCSFNVQEFIPPGDVEEFSECLRGEVLAADEKNDKAGSP